MNRIELIRLACNKIQGKQSKLVRRQNELQKIVDSVLRSEYTTKQAGKLEFSALDFN